MGPIIKAVEVDNSGEFKLTLEAKEFAEKLILDSFNVLRKSFNKHYDGVTFMPGDEAGYNTTKDGNAFKISFDIKELLRKTVAAKRDLSTGKSPIMPIELEYLKEIKR